MAVERYGSKTDVVVKLVLVFFIALLSFSIGTFVGKKFSDNQHKLAQLEPTEHESISENQAESGDRDVASVNHEPAEAKPNEALSDEDIAKLAEEFVSDDEEGEATTEKAKEHIEPNPEHASHETTASRKVASNPSAEAERVAHGKTPTEMSDKKPTTKAMTTALPAAIGSNAVGKFTVQVASFAEEAEAQKRAADLKAQGFNAFYVSAAIKGKTWYRVSVGLFATQKEASAYKEDLVTRAKVTTAIIQKISSLQ